MSAQSPSARVHTFGCRLNINESAAIEAAIAGRDDLAVVNSCAVTGEAVRQARQTIRRLHREDPARRVVVTGCAAQVDPGAFAAMPEVAHVVGNAEKLRRETWDGLDEAPRIAVSDIMASRHAAAPALRAEGRTRAFLQVQNGCDHRCTFCVIPFGRGNSRSVLPDDAVASARRLVEDGAREIVLTGVDLTSYGRDISEDWSLGRLVRHILREVPELPRLRISSVDSIEVDDELLAVLAEDGRLMPHLHLSLQAGSDMILKRMKRRHSRAEAIAFCEEARRRRPDIVFGADLIAGFPTETEAMFAESLALIDECDIVWLHAFPFSARPGTPAARMPQLPGPLARERAARLREAGDARARSFLASQIGTTQRALTERGGTARTDQFTPVHLNSPYPAGEIIDIIVTGQAGRGLEAVPSPA